MGGSVAVAAPYAITGVLHDAGDVVLRRAVRVADGRPVLLKTLAAPRAAPVGWSERRARLMAEWELGRRLATDAIVRPLSFENVSFDTLANVPTLVLEDFGGAPMQPRTPLAPARFLPLAIRVARATAALHAAGIVHKDLKPEHVFVHPDTLEVKISGLGIASPVQSARAVARASRRLEGSPAYMAPEQTGWTNRPIDARADLYALGIMFHQLLTGRLPFDAEDALEWVHNHVARTPPPVSAAADVPAPISDIIGKLLAKSPEDRYQSARGLELDLAECLARLEATGDVAPFPLGARDVPDALRLPQRLYARDAPLAALRAAFARAAHEGTRELVLVRGPPGIGKSALVRELAPLVLHENGSFAEGKWDQVCRDIVYAGVAQAVRELSLDVLAGTESSITKLRERARAELGPHARLLVDVVPELELLLGKQDPLREVPADERQHRLHGAFRRLLGLLAGAGHPLVLLLDDVQWADPSSIALVAHVLSDPEIDHVLIALGAREDVQPLLGALEEIRSAGASITTIDLAPLSVDETTGLLSDTFRQPPEAVSSLARLVHEKTGGNPFFTRELLLALDRDRLVAFDDALGAWRWDVEAIRAKGLTDDVLELLIAKLRELPRHTCEALEFAAAAGSGTTASTLAALLGVPEERARESLAEAVRDGLVFVDGDVHRFVHDRVQQAAYALMSEQERARVHLLIARVLRARLASEPTAEALFEVARHASLSAGLVIDRDERLAHARLCIAAARRARAAAAFDASRAHALAGLSWLPADGWDTQRDLELSLSLAAAEADVQVGDLDAAEQRLRDVLPRARTRGEKAAIHALFVQLHTKRGESDRAIESAAACLSLFDVTIVAHPSAELVEAAERRMFQTLGGRTIEDLRGLPLVEDADLEAATNVLGLLLPTAYFSDVRLHRLVAIHLVDLALREGIVPASAMGFAAFGLELCISRRYAEAERFGTFARALVELHAFTAKRGMVYLLVGAATNAFCNHLRTSIPYLHESVRSAVDTGDFLFACFATNQVSICRFWIGDPLDEIEREANGAVELVRRARYEPMVPIVATLRNLARALGDPGRATLTLDGPDVEERAFERDVAPVTVPVVTFTYWLHKLVARTLQGDVPGALDAARRADALVIEMRGQYPEAAFHGICGVAIAMANHGDADVAEIARHREWLRPLAEHCPENFANMHALVSAELARVEQRDLEAIELYERAIGSSRAHGFVQWEALACERCAAHHLARGRPLAAEGYLIAARDAYERWGAAAKVRDLERRHPSLRERRRPGADDATLAIRAEQLDAISISKASQTISSAIVLEELVGTLLRLVLEQAGADRGVLLLRRGDELVIAGDASITSKGEREAVVVDIDSAQEVAPEAVPLSVIGFVRRTSKPVIVDEDATRSGRFAADPYFARSAPRSMLCAPIVLQGATVGVLYLENRVLAGAFGPERLAAVDVLARQAAISLENARLLGDAKAARARAEAAERRAAFLAEASALLLGSSEIDATLAALAELCVGRVADWCVIEVVEGAEIRRITGAHVDRSRRPLLEELGRRYPTRRDGPSVTSVALRTATLASSSAEELRTTCDDDEHMTGLRALHTEAQLAVPIVARGEVLGVITMASAARGAYGADDLAVAEELARRAASAIDQARSRRKTEEAVHLRDVFLAIASHELRTPLTSLRLHLQLLTRSLSAGEAPSAETLRHGLDRALAQVSRLRGLVEQLLDVSRLTGGPLDLDRSGVDLAEVVREVVDRARAAIEASGSSVAIDAPGPVVGSWDRLRVEQVVTNLLDNAIKFGAGRPIEIRVEALPARARLYVRDHGLGIAPNAQARVFRKFERAVSERNYGGLGLGLYIARQIVESHGGSISVHSTPDLGSTFVVELPR
ncbi:MAG: AAA family ATPase [Deltaproteobacteria bacterium]|nr:AAA family ATPase [Deltaproteobacteria bacterium]